MQGHIRKRVHTCKDGKQTTHWYVVGTSSRASTVDDVRSGMAGSGRAARPR